MRSYLSFCHPESIPMPIQSKDVILSKSPRPANRRILRSASFYAGLRMTGTKYQRF